MSEKSLSQCWREFWRAWKRVHIEPRVLAMARWLFGNQNDAVFVGRYIMNGWPHDAKLWPQITHFKKSTQSTKSPDWFLIWDQNRKSRWTVIESWPRLAIITECHMKYSYVRRFRKHVRSVRNCTDTKWGCIRVTTNQVKREQNAIAEEWNRMKTRRAKGPRARWAAPPSDTEILVMYSHQLGSNPMQNLPFLPTQSNVLEFSRYNQSMKIEDWRQLGVQTCRGTTWRGSQRESRRPWRRRWAEWLRRCSRRSRSCPCSSWSERTLSTSKQLQFQFSCF